MGAARARSSGSTPSCRLDTVEYRNRPFRSTRVRLVSKISAQLTNYREQVVGRTRAKSPHRDANADAKQQPIAHVIRNSMQACESKYLISLVCSHQRSRQRTYFSGRYPIEMVANAPTGSSLKSQRITTVRPQTIHTSSTLRTFGPFGIFECERERDMLKHALSCFGASALCAQRVTCFHTHTQKCWTARLIIRSQNKHIE